MYCIIGTILFFVIMIIMCVIPLSVALKYEEDNKKVKGYIEPEVFNLRAGYAVQVSHDNKTWHLRYFVCFIKEDNQVYVACTKDGNIIEHIVMSNLEYWEFASTIKDPQDIKEVI